VLDGARHPLKAHTNHIRQMKSADACLEMQNLIESGDQDNLKKISTLKKRGLCVREDVLAGFVKWCDDKSVRYVCAFMEAEWDLCRLERDGVIDAVASEDSDCFVLGCMNMIHLLDIRIIPANPNCTIISGTCWSELVNTVLPDATLGEMADFAVLLGVDYLDRSFGN
jgi:5'-3' exonuclease